MIEIVAATKEKLVDETAVRTALAKMRPNHDIESIVDKGVAGWIVRLADKPPFLQDKDDDAAPEGSPEEEATETPDEEKAEDSPDGDKKPGDKGDKPKGDVASELKDLMSQLQDVIKQVTDKAGDAVSEVEDHRDKLDKAKDALGDEGGLPPDLDGAPPMPGDVGPTPGKPPMPGGISPGGPPMPPRRPGMPTGKRPIQTSPSVFTKRRTEIVTHAGIDDTGSALTLLEAANALESDGEWSEYKIVGMTENADGSFSAKLRLR